VGRGVELDQVKELLSEARLVTLTGAGGIGKTRLALEVGARLLQDYEDGVWLVELAGLTDPTLVPQAVANALGFMSRPGLGPIESLVSLLGARELLCVLDNCEHLIEATARLADIMLKHCPGLRILATSRDVLGVGGEVTCRVPSMPMPAVQRSHTLDELRACETVQLLVQRARAARPGFELNDDNAPSVVRICQRVDGIPLAIELVAARIRGMSMSAIDERIADRFNLVAGGSRVSMPRQRTLQATFDWSHDLLSEEEKRVFRRLSVFVGGFTLDAAEAVYHLDEAEGTDQSSIESLAGLVDKSLVISQEGVDAAGRYRLLEPIRQYAYDRLFEAQEADAARREHAEFYLTLGEDMSRELRGPRQRSAAMARVAEDVDNFRACFGWALSYDPPAALQLGVALERFWAMKSATEGREWMQRALELYDARDSLRAHALYDAAFWAWNCGDFDEARRLGNESLALARGLGSDLYTGQALSALAVVASSERPEGWLAYCRSLCDQAERHIRAADDLEALGRLLNNYGCILQMGGDLINARAKIEEALGLARGRNDIWMITATLESLAQVEYESGETGNAERDWKQVLELAGPLGDQIESARALVGLARLVVASQPERSLLLLGAASSLVKFPDVGDPDMAEVIEDAQRKSQALLGDEVSEAIWHRGTNMSLLEAVRFALGEAALADLATTATPIAGAAQTDDRNAFVREGEFWSLTYQGVAAHLKDSKGLRDIARLLAIPGREVAAVDLASGELVGIAGGTATLGELGLGVEGDGGEALDAEARAQYRARLSDLEEDIAEAEADNDPERTSRAREEREFLLAELRAAVGLGGRSRRVLDPAERARKAVTGRIRDAVSHIETAHPELGRHLRRSVRTGSFCVYDPAEPSDWRLSGGEPGTHP
jgi:non-specific serine/threonine protein kinase